MVKHRRGPTIVPQSAPPMLSNLPLPHTHTLTHRKSKSPPKSKNPRTRPKEQSFSPCRTAMEISSTTASVPKPPSSLPLSSSRSRFLANNATSAAFLTRNKANTGALVLGGRRRRTGFRTEPARKGLICNSLFGLGVPELVVIAGVTALVFGPKKLPEVGRSIGKTIKSFQQAAKEFESELKTPVSESTTEAPADKPTAVIEEEKKDVTVPSSKENV